jgi:hypothetical protein
MAQALTARNRDRNMKASKDMPPKKVGIHLAFASGNHSNGKIFHTNDL